MSKLIQTESICKLRGKHLWIPPWWKGRRVCALCGRYESLTIGNNSIQLSPGGVDVIKWSASGAPSASGELGMDVSTGLPQCYTGGTATALAVGGSGGGLTLVEQKTLTSDVSQYDFSSLDGDSDYVYLLTFHIFNYTAGNSTIYLEPNGSTTNDSSKHMRWWSTANASASYNTSTVIANVPISNYAAGFVYLFANSSSESQAFKRSYFGMSVNNLTELAYGHMRTGLWADTSTNITSLRVRGEMGTGSQLALYKLAQS